MKRKKIIYFIATFSLLGLLITGCSKNMPEVKLVRVESIELSPELSEGVLMETGKTKNISMKVTVMPKNATEIAQNFYTDDPEVATVDQKGVLFANAPGTTNVSIVVDGKSVSFMLEVVDIIPIPFTDITLSTSTKELAIDETFNMAMLISTEPLMGSNDVLQFSSSNQAAVTVDDKGVLTCVAFGKSTITVSSKFNPDVKAELEVTAYKTVDHDRSSWTMTASQTLFVEASNSLTSAMDGDVNTWFGLVRPSKSYGGVTVPRKEDGGFISFTIDMKVETVVDFFRIRHKNTKDLFLRYYKIEDILGSNDGETFTSIAKEIDVLQVAELSIIESPDIIIPSSKYRYLKIYCAQDWCFQSMSKGASAQLSEFYLGKKIYE